MEVSSLCSSILVSWHQRVTLTSLTAVLATGAANARVCHDGSASAEWLQTPWSFLVSPRKASNEKQTLAARCGVSGSLKSLSQNRSGSFNQKKKSALPCYTDTTNSSHFFISLCTLRCVYPGLQSRRLHVDGDYLIWEHNFRVVWFYFS